MKRSLSSCLSALIILSAPGLAPYHALAQNLARPAARVELLPALTVAPGAALSAPSLPSGPSLTAPSLAVPSLVPVPAAQPVAVAPVALAPAAALPAPAKPSVVGPSLTASGRGTSSPDGSVAVQALKTLGATPKLSENAPALRGFYDASAARRSDEESAVLAAAAKETPSGLTPWLPAAPRETSVIGAARTPKGYVRAAARRLADGWPYLVIGAVAALAHHFFGPEAAFAVLMAAGPCAAFRAMQDGEALRLGISNEENRKRAMEEMQQILRQFGRDAAKAGESDPEVQSRVDAEIMTRSALQGVTHALEYFLKIARAEELELPAAKERLKQLVRTAVVGAMKANGMPGDDEATIQKILDKTGLTAKVMDWESRHMVVESILAAVREEKKKASSPGSASGAAGQAKKEKGGAAGSVKAPALWSRLFGAPATGDKKPAPAQPAQPAQPELPPLPETPMVHHLQLAGYTREEIEFFLSAARDVAETPFSPVEGRHEEIRRAVETLSRPAGRPKNLLLVGAEGVGKRALVETLAREIAEKRYKGLEDVRVLEFDASAAVGGNVEGLALQLRALLAKGKGKVVLYIDHPGHLKNQSLNEHNFFKIMAPYMERGDVTLIVSADAVERRLLEDKGPFPFETVELGQPSLDKAAAMLEAHAPALQERYGLRAAPGLFEAAARLAARYLAKTALPGSGLDLLERAFSARSAQSQVNRAEAEFRRRLERAARNLRRLKDGRDDAETATRRRNAVAEDLDALHLLKEVIAEISAQSGGDSLVRESDLAEEASRLSGIPASKMLQSEREKLLGLESKLKSRVIHQDEAVTAVAEAVRRARAGLKDPNKPIGSFLFLGPTGVGKTELTKALAETLFDSEANMIRLDMSEYMEPHSVARLIGSPPGYVGFDAGGQLTEAVRAKPYSVVLLDEVEKAHPDVLNVLLQAMDDGRVTDGQGRTVAFGNVIFVLTSNLGSAHIMELMKDGADRSKIKDDVMGAVRQHFRPEFINRLDETVIFNPLGREQAGPIVDIHMNAKVRRWLADQGIELERASASAVERLAELGFDPLYGGRPLARAVQKFVLNPLSEKLLAASADEDERVRVRRKAVLDVVDGVITPRLENLPAQAVQERKPAHPAASAAWLSLLDLPEARLTTEAVEAFVFGPPEKDLPSADHGAFKPMGALKGGAALETIAASTDDPNLKDPELDRATKLWSAAAKLKGDAAEAFRRWMSKVARCAKSTNNLRPAPHELVSYSVHEGDGFREYRVKGLPLTRAELLLNARIFENHYGQDSASEDQSWELADALLTRGEYGRAELFEIKRLLSAIPGAEFGYFSDREALTFWLRLPSADAKAVKAVEPKKEAAAPVEKPAEAAAAEGARLGADDADADAPSQYRFLTQDAPEHMRQLHAMVARLLSAADPIAVFWGFRFARAALGEKGFEPMRKFLPPLAYLNADARNAYLAEASLRPYYREISADPGVQAVVARALGSGSSNSYDATAAARELALGSTMAPETSKSFVDGILAPYRRFVRNHAIHVRARVATTPLWILAAGVALVSLITGRYVLFTSWPDWAAALTSIALLAGIIFTNVVGWSDWIYNKADRAYDAARPQIDIARTVAPRLRPEDRKRLAEHFEAIVRGRWAANKREDYDSSRDELRNAHWAAAVGLEELREELSPERRRSIAEAVMARAETPAKKKQSSIADRLAPLMMLELLDDAQKSRALELALEHVTYDNSPATGRFLRLAREGRLPAGQSEAVIQQLVRALGARTADSATVGAMAETLAVLAAAQPDNMRLATFEAAFGSRNLFSSHEGSGAEKPVAYYAALRRLSPHRKAMERIADHLLSSNRAKIDQLSWLLAQPELDAQRKELAIDQLVRAGEGDPRQDSTWNAIPVVARMTSIPRERRVAMLLAALNRLSQTEANRGNEFTYYARAVEAVRLLTELEAAP